MSGNKPAPVRLIPNWREAWKFASVQFAAWGLVLTTALEVIGHAWGVLPFVLQQRLPNSSTVAVVFFGLVLVGRVLTFRRIKNQEKEDDFVGGRSEPEDY